MTWKKKGNRIRASDKSLVYHFCIGWLLLLFVAVFLLLNLRQLLITDLKDFIGRLTRKEQFFRTDALGGSRTGARTVFRAVLIYRQAAVNIQLI